MESKELFERLNELSESKEYRKDFNELKKNILSKGNRNPRKFVKYHFPDDWDGDLKKVIEDITPGRLKCILESGNLNQSWILIPNPYSSFRDKWDLEYFFDPSRDFPDNFKPFKRRDAVTPCFPPMSEKEFEALPEGTIDPYKIYLEINLMFPKIVIFKEIKKEIKEHIELFRLETMAPKGRPQTKYSQRKLMRKIWEEHCKGRRLTGYQKSRIISEKLGHIPDPMTIYRHHLREIEGEARNR